MTSSPLVQLSTKARATHRVVIDTAKVGVAQTVRALCRTNFLVFQKVELQAELGPQHRMWWEHLKTGDDVCELAPRDHGKSYSMVRAYSIWRLKYDPWVRDCLILGADQPSAVENLDKIKEMMDGSASLRHLLPIGRADGTNSRTEMLLRNGKRLKTKGLMSPLRGRHPQLVILDDILNDENSWSSDSRSEVKKRFNEVIVPLKDKGTRKDQEKGYRSQLVVVGTAQDNDDLYHDLLKNPNFRGVKLSAIVDEEKRISLWSDRYSYDDLMKIKTTVGALAFSKEWLNKPLSDETTIFPTTLFPPMFDDKLSYARNYTGFNQVFLGVDFSVPGSVDGDWTVVVAIEFDRSTQTYTLLNYWRAQPTEIMEQLRQIEYYCQIYKVTLGFLEDNLFQGIYREHFRRKSTLPLRGHTVTGGNKRSHETGILAFRPMFENQRFRFPYATEADKNKTDYILTEFNGIRQKHGRIGNETTHDDLVMALWHATSASRTSVFQADFG